MALFINGKRQKINLNSVARILNIYYNIVKRKGWLFSADDYILTDSNGLILVAKDPLPDVVKYGLFSADDYILTDSNGLILVAKEPLPDVVRYGLFSADDYLLTDSNGLILIQKEVE